jgi:hypothetical protein
MWSDHPENANPRHTIPDPSERFWLNIHPALANKVIQNPGHISPVIPTMPEPPPPEHGKIFSSVGMILRTSHF